MTQTQPQVSYDSHASVLKISQLPATPNQQQISETHNVTRILKAIESLKNKLMKQIRY